MSGRASNNIPPSLLKIWKEEDSKMSSPQKYTGRAIVSHDKLPNKGWKMEDRVTCREPREDELVVEMVASGICHTDVHFGSADPLPPLMFYPRVMGHEGSGYVRAVGSKVTVAKPGDPVLLSYTCCGSCISCKSSHPSVCYDFNAINFGKHDVFTLEGSQQSVSGRFFGQSSFAQFSIVDQKSVVNAKDLVKDKEELKLFAPLGCGIQTGSGTVVNVAKPTEDDSIAILGLGGVGLSAIMAAKISGCRIIVGIDRVEKRLEMAKQFGATHVVDSSRLPEGKSLVQAVREIADGVGPNFTIDTTGVPPLVRQAIEMTRNFGTTIQVGTAPPDATLDVGIFPFMAAGKKYVGAIEGDSIPQSMVPRMIEWYRKGQFPFDKFIKLMPADEFDKGLHEMHTGETVKPVIVWSD